MCSQRFIIERNIDQFHSRFLFEENPDTRDMLLCPLVQEENKFYNRRE